jgi:hypothetical protein
VLSVCHMQILCKSSPRRRPHATLLSLRVSLSHYGMYARVPLCAVKNSAAVDSGYCHARRFLFRGMFNMFAAVCVQGVKMDLKERKIRCEHL